MLRKRDLVCGRVLNCDPQRILFFDHRWAFIIALITEDNFKKLIYLDIGKQTSK